MRRLGKVLHLSKSRNLILRLESPPVPAIGSEICDYKLKKIGTVNNILGPVKSPYVSILPSTNVTEGLSGRVLYLIEKE